MKLLRGKKMRSDIAFLSFNKIPNVNTSFKYLKLGRIALENHKYYCQQHGYNYIQNVEVDSLIPACWSKIKAIIDAFNNFKWVLWADSDTLIVNTDIKLESFLNSENDIISQCPVTYFDKLSLTSEQCYKLMPLNTGAFFIQNTSWSMELLQEVYEKRPVNYSEALWDGFGEQEAIIDILKERKDGFEHVSYTSNLQSHPKFYNRDIMFIHFYGNHAVKRLSIPECKTIISRWEDSISKRENLPEDRIRFHYACIQNFKNDPMFRRRVPEFFLYTEEEITRN
jgi:hypothetical protein